MLAESGVKSIPFVHLKQNDMPPEELDYLIKDYGTKIFCVHPQSEYPFIYDYSRYKNKICLENTFGAFDEEELKDFAGICLDLSHLENNRLLNKEDFEKSVKCLRRYPLIANHISAVKQNPLKDESGKYHYSCHYLENLSQLDYLKRYPLSYFAPFIAIELENSLKEQLTVRDYLTELLNR